MIKSKEERRDRVGPRRQNSQQSAAASCPVACECVSSGAAIFYPVNGELIKQTGSLHTKRTDDAVESETPIVMRIATNYALGTIPSMVNRFAHQWKPRASLSPDF
jgi:hypothetical protein